MLAITVKQFSELNITELYELLRLRSEVFVVEQNCVYQDVDDKDKTALHVLGKKEGKIVAYTRIFRPGDYFKEASIGRVVVAATERKFGFGKEIMIASIKAVENQLSYTTIKISAQCYLQKFYKSLGFESVGEEYLEDGIPHIGMIKN
ncbi:GNAT family N-acetyltransferase [Maribacter sp. 2210JD10-5]|uniref:GNAT family N-acetyltransferase n=1 Tax=Maribacter sp. 2210JD10-5 TaxID=3386272 RepID=UPI0039BC40CF